jgi:hypothetical protein
MIRQLERFLAMFRVTHATRDEYLNAETDDMAHDVGKIVERVQRSIARRSRGNEALRRSIQIAKSRTNSFADFERMAIRREELK